MDFTVRQIIYMLFRNMQVISIYLVWLPTYNVTNIVNKAHNRPNFKIAILKIVSTNLSIFFYVTAHNISTNICTRTVPLKTTYKYAQMRNATLKTTFDLEGSFQGQGRCHHSIPHPRFTLHGHDIKAETRRQNVLNIVRK